MKTLPRLGFWPASIAAKFMVCLAALALAAPLPTAAAAGSRLVVSPDGPYTAIEAALAQARPGDTVEVRAGRYAGPLVVETAGVILAL
jgi:hypothetical protein